MRLALCLYPGAVPSGLFALAEILTAANRFIGHTVFELEWAIVGEATRLLQPHPLAPQAEAIAAQPLHKVAYDALILPGFWLEHAAAYDTALAALDQTIKDLQTVDKQADMYAYCTAVGLLAESRHLQQRKATCTWWLDAAYRKRYPQTCWTNDDILRRDDGIMTAAGLNGYLPIARHLVLRYTEARVWLSIEDLMVLPKPRNNAPPFANIEQLKYRDPLLTRIFLWVEQRRADALKLPVLAAMLNISESTLTRRVHTLASMSPGKLLRAIKLMQAGQQLRFSRVSVAALSDQLGYLDDTVFRRSFKQYTGLTPQQFRQRYQ